MRSAEHVASTACAASRRFPFRSADTKAHALPFHVQVWRVGLMGYNAKPCNVALVLDAFRDGLTQQGFLKA